jgi:hypothetical protein
LGTEIIRRTRTTYSKAQPWKAAQGKTTLFNTAIHASKNKKGKLGELPPMKVAACSTPVEDRDTDDYFIRSRGTRKAVENNDITVLDYLIDHMTLSANIAFTATSGGTPSSNNLPNSEPGIGLRTHPLTNINDGTIMAPPVSPGPPAMPQQLQSTAVTLS